MFQRENVTDVCGHAFADAGDREKGLLVLINIGKLLIMALNGLGCATIRANAERILRGHLQQVSRLIQNIGDGLIVCLHRDNFNRCGFVLVACATNRSNIIDHHWLTFRTCCIGLGRKSASPSFLVAGATNRLEIRYPLRFNVLLP